jgi:hypothetical protein
MNSVNEENMRGRAVLLEKCRIRAEVVQLTNVELEGDGTKLISRAEVLKIINGKQI